MRPTISSAETTSFPVSVRSASEYLVFDVGASHPIWINRSHTQTALIALPLPVSMSAITGIRTDWTMFR
jgi:hypothetical protein